MMDQKSTPYETTFREMVSRREDEIDLAAAALLIAREHNPNLPVEKYLNRMKLMANVVRLRLGDSPEPKEMVEGINNHLFNGEGFGGNEADYYDPRNSFLNEVIDRRRGIPITLSILYLEVAANVGLAMSGVGFPGHFLVKYQSEQEEIIVDPFGSGVMLTREDCANRLRVVSGGQAPFREHYLSAITKKQILRRVLTNLKGIYLSSSEYGRSLWAVEMLLAISPWDVDEIRDRGKIYYQLKEYENSLADLETYLEFNKGADDAKKIGQYIEHVREMVSKAN